METTGNLRNVDLQARNEKLAGRVALFKQFMAGQSLTYKRSILSAAGREVAVCDPFTGRQRNMLMFASNNYLGLANHPRVAAAAKKAIDEFGAGIGGPPLLNGYIRLIEEAEERLAAFKSKQAAVIFSSGFMANLGITGALAECNDVLIYDELSHASFYDSLRLTKAKTIAYRHNDLVQLEQLLQQHRQAAGTVFVYTEGVFSMDGDTAPLNSISKLCEQFSAQLILDDAHGTGVLGDNGTGTAAHFHCEDSVTVGMGTFSKAFATCGGFLTASADLVDYIRYHARSYIFSASVPPPVPATVIAGLDVMEEEPWRRQQLLQNVQYAIQKLSPFVFYATPQAAIITLRLPAGMDIRKAALLFHERNIFINPVEYPAVPQNKQRFRISLMSAHSTEDINQLAAVTEEVWSSAAVYE